MQAKEFESKNKLMCKHDSVSCRIETEIKRKLYVIKKNIYVLKKSHSSLMENLLRIYRLQDVNN